MATQKISLSTCHRDKFGFLTKREDWSPALAQLLADEENIKLTDAHYQVIAQAQLFYDQFDLSPAMRPLIKFLQQQLGNHINSIYLLSLFPGSPAKLISKIAGLPKPDNCF